MTVEEKIVELFKTHDDWTPKEITSKLDVSKQMVHRVLQKLVEKQELIRYGRPPKVIYRKNDNTKKELPTITLPEEEEKFLEDNFLLISETGEYKEGANGFQVWCNTRNLPYKKTVQEFIKTKRKYNQYIDKHGYINGTEKLKNTKGFEDTYVDALYYLDFYAIERFGKTKLGTLLHYAKQGQNKYLMRKLLAIVESKIKKLIEIKKANAVGFVPPTIRREVQIMSFMENALNIEKPTIDLQKIKQLIPVPQKSLNKLNERINNADTTFSVFENTSFETVILIDDAVGSGATINQIAKKIKQKKIAKSVIGLAIVGSFKGFDVITDV